MKRTLSILAVAALGLTACTDQPVEPEPEATATVTETITAEPADDLASPDRAARSIADMLEEPTPEDILLAEEALAGLEETITVETEDHNCSIVADAIPEVTAYGTVSSQDEDLETSRGLAALGFHTVADAAAFTDHLQTMLQDCDADSYEITPLTHHTDEAIEIHIEHSDDPATSVVLIRNQYWVLTAVSTPPTDVALSLTQLDQLDETLR